MLHLVIHSNAPLSEIRTLNAIRKFSYFQAIDFGHCYAIADFSAGRRRHLNFFLYGISRETSMLARLKIS